MAAALGVVLLLSCSSIEEAIQESKCTSSQGEWDAATKTCVTCPSGTTKQTDGQCVASAIQTADGAFICPPRTTKNANGVCVADAVSVDPAVAASKFYCDYGKTDPLATIDTHEDCVEVEYESQCDKTWGKLAPSCQDKDRRTDKIYCDYGPVDEYGGGCYLILSAGDCNSEWGIVAGRCGTHARWPNGTECPAGKVKSGNSCIAGSNNNNNSEKFCFYGTAAECFPIGSGASQATEAICEENWGMVVTSCSNVILDYCDWGQPIITTEGNVERGCFAIRTAKERSDCQWGTIRNSCPDYACPTGAIKIAENGWGNSGCRLN